MRQELLNSFAEFWGASATAVEKALRLMLTALIALCQLTEKTLRAIRQWLDDGAKFPDLEWLVPGARLRRLKKEGVQ